MSLIGLVPQTGGRDVIRAALRAGGLATSVTDMLESASDPAPDGWQEALGFSLSVLSELPRAKISVAPKSVRVVAVADSDDERARLEDRLQQAKPEGVTLILEVSAPRAVIAPFAFDFSLQDGVGRMDACSAATPDAAAAILAGAKAAGLAGDADCPVGLGVPLVRLAGGGEPRARSAEAAGRRALHLERHGGRAHAPRGRAGGQGGGGGGEARRRPPRRLPARHEDARGGRRGGRAGPAAGVRGDAFRRGRRAPGRDGDRRDLARRDPELRRGALRPRSGDGHDRDRPGAARGLARAGAGRRRGAGGARAGQGRRHAREGGGRRLGPRGRGERQGRRTPRVQGGRRGRGARHLRRGGGSRRCRCGAAEARALCGPDQRHPRRGVDPVLRAARPTSCRRARG